MSLKDKIKKFDPQNPIHIGNFKINYDKFNDNNGKIAFIPGKTNLVN